MSISLLVVFALLAMLMYYTYTKESTLMSLNSANLAKLAELQSIIATKASSPDLYAVKLDLLKKISSTIESVSATQADVDTLKLTTSIISNLSEDSSSFKKFMEESIAGSAESNLKIVNMAKDIATKVSKDDLTGLLSSKANIGDVSRLATLITNIENRLGNNISEKKVLEIISVKADKAVVDNIVSSVSDMNARLVTMIQDTSAVESVKYDLGNAVAGINKSIDDLRNSSKDELSGKLDSLLKETIEPLSNSLASSTESLKKSIDDMVSQISTMKAGLDGKADVTLVNSMNTNLQKLLVDVPELRSSMEILYSMVTKLYYVPENAVTFSPGTTYRFAMVADSGVANISYRSYNKDINTSISLEQMRHLISANDGAIAFGSKVWFRSQIPIDSGKPTRFIPHSYIQALMNLDSLVVPAGSVMADFSYEFSPAPIASNTDYNVVLNKPTAWSTYPESESLLILSRIMNRAIQSIINLSSRYDCAMEIVIDFSVTRSITSVKARPAVIEWKSSKDQSFRTGSRYQPKVYVNAAIDASNGLIVPTPTYFLPESYLGGINVTKDSKARCPMNSYMCGLQNIGSSQIMYPMCCEFNPGTSFSSPL